MGVSKIKGIVLSSFDYSDNDKIVTIFSDKFGKISFLSLGANKINSKNRYSLLTFSFSEFQIFKARENQGISKLKTGILIDNHLKITQNYDHYLYLVACSSIVEFASEFGHKNFYLFNNLKKLIENLNQADNAFASFVYFLFFNFKFFGGFWQLKQCFRCQKKYQTYRLFSLDEFGLICPNCFDEKIEMIQDAEWISFLKELSQDTFDLAIKKFVPINYLIILGKILINYYREILGIDNIAFKKILNKDFFVFNYTYSVLTKSKQFS